MSIEAANPSPGRTGPPPPPAPAEPGGMLCERCGYALGGLPPGVASCPECGTAIEASRPERRIGTPWQRAPGAGSWLATNWFMLRRPRATFGIAAMTRSGSAQLLRVNLLAAALILAGGACVHMIRSDVFIALFPPTWWRVPISATATALLIGLPVAFGSLWALTWIEARGIRFFGRRRGWRITPASAWAICGHASVGWIVAAALGTIGLVAAWLLDIQPVRQIAPNTFTYDPVRPWRAPIGGFLAGLVIFEVLVNFGVRRCRYANAAAPPTGV